MFFQRLRLYLLTGPKANSIRNGVEKVYLDVQSTKKLADSTGQNSAGRDDAKGSNSVVGKDLKGCSSGNKPSTSRQDSRPKVVIVNKETSAFADKSFSSFEKDKVKNDRVAMGDGLINSAEKGKRKKYVVSSDNDSDLDFGDVLRKKKKKSR